MASTQERRIDYQGHAVHASEGETALEALLRVGANIPFSCKSGVCHTCLVKCTEGSVPAEAQRGLPPHLMAGNYLLACKCLPVTSMALAPKDPQDLLTECMLVDVEGHGTHELRIQFEPARELSFETGQRVRLLVDTGREPELELISDPKNDYPVMARLRLAPDQAPPGVFGPEFEFGASFTVRGPFAAAPTAEAPPHASEQGWPAPDLELWAKLGHGKTIRTVLESFYPKVYADERLKGFFERATMERLIEKQYSFLKQCLTGEKIYFGDRPRNAHHWMIVSDELFDYRERIMLETLQEHGVAPDLIERLMRVEEHFRRDIVKHAAWPRRLGGMEIHTEGYGEETLGIDSVCDHCGGEIPAGTRVRYHLRLGQISCSGCTSGAALAA